MNFDLMCENYKKNYFEIKALDSLLKSGSDFDSWLVSMKERSQALRKYYQENNEILRHMSIYESSPFESDEEAMKCYNKLMETYRSYVDDPEFLVPALRKLISYFERKRDIPYLIDLYYIAFFEINEMECKSANVKADLTYQLKTLELKRYYKTLDLEQRVKFFKVYYNLAYVSLGMNSVTPMESYFWYQEAKEFFYSDVVQPIDKDNPEINREFKKLSHDWITIIFDADELAVDALSDVFRLITDLYEEALDEGVYRVDPVIYAAYLEMERLKRNKKLGEVIEEYMEYFRFNVSLIKGDYSMDNFKLFYQCPKLILKWLSKSQDTFFKKRIFDEINDTVLFQGRMFENHIEPHLVHSMLAEWCYMSIPYFTTDSEKEKTIFELIIKNQVPTYLHSVMVMNLAVKLFEVSYRKKPELYRGLHMDYEELQKYVKKAALFHDIGKIKVTDIINRQGRKLSVTEFQGIMSHPEFGMNLIESDPDLKIYSDVIKYHHKYYDGTKGYPYGDMNTKSPYRIMIDLVTICDCLDAATDVLGRNYKLAKTVDEVFTEFGLGAGTRYNPDLVEIILASPSLHDEFVKICTDNRAHLMYDAYTKSQDIIKEQLF